MTRRRARAVALWIVAGAFVLAGASACASRTQAPSPFDGARPSGASASDDLITLEIQNLSFNDITVWAVRAGGQRTRVARVTGKSNEQVRIGWNVAFTISFYVEQTAGRSCRTGDVGVEPNARVVVAVPSNVGLQPCRAWRR